MFGNWIILDSVHRIYPNELEVKDNTLKVCVVLVIDNEGRLKTKLYYKRNDFTFPIVNFSFISSNIQASPAYGVYISQLILTQGYVAPRLKSLLHKLYGRHHNMVDR